MRKDLTGRLDWRKKEGMNTMLSNDAREEMVGRVRRFVALTLVGVLVTLVVYATLIAPAVHQINAAAAAFGR